jgi:hypothetical protein
LDIFRRDHAVGFFEATAEIGRTAHAHHETDLADRVASREQQVLGVLHLVFADILVGGDACERLHLAVESADTDVQFLSQIAHVDISRDALLDEMVELLEELPVDIPQRGLQLLALQAEVWLRVGDAVVELLPLSEQIVDARAEQSGRERLGEIRVCPGVVAHGLVGIGVFCRQQNDGDVGGAYIVFDFPAQLVAVHPGHHDVADDDVGRCLLCYLPSLFTVFGLSDVKQSGKYRSDELSDVLVVFDNKEEKPLSSSPPRGGELLARSLRKYAGLLWLR